MTLLRVITFGTFQDATATLPGSLRNWKSGLRGDRLRGAHADLEGRANYRVSAQVEVAESNSMISPGGMGLLEVAPAPVALPARARLDEHAPFAGGLLRDAAQHRDAARGVQRRDTRDPDPGSFGLSR